MKKNLIFLVLLILLQQVTFGKSIDLLSPDSSIKISVNLSDKIYYSVSSNNQILFENSSLMLKLSSETPWSKSKTCREENQHDKRNHPTRNFAKECASEKQLQCIAAKFQRRLFGLNSRAYNDGVAYRFITNKKSSEIEVLDEEGVTQITW